MIVLICVGLIILRSRCSRTSNNNNNKNKKVNKTKNINNNNINNNEINSDINDDNNENNRNNNLIDEYDKNKNTVLKNDEIMFRNESMIDAMDKHER